MDGQTNRPTPICNLRIFFTTNPNLKKDFFFFFGGGGEGMDGQTNRPKPICPFNFFEVGGITMH